MIWRSIHDCRRNCISTYFDHYIGKKKAHKKNSEDKIKMINIRYTNTISTWYIRKKKINYKDNGDRGVIKKKLFEV